MNASNIQISIEQARVVLHLHAQSKYPGSYHTLLEELIKKRVPALQHDPMTVLAFVKEGYADFLICSVLGIDYEDKAVPDEYVPF